MLAALPHAPKPAPRPANWRGVGAGLGRADKLIRRGEYDKAAETLSELLEFAPLEPKAWHLLGRVKQGMGNHDEALLCFDRAQACYAGNAQRQPASIRLAKLLWQQGEREKARAMLGVLMMRYPESADLTALYHEWGEGRS